MKVYILMGGYDYEDSYVLSAYSTEEKANKAKEAQSELDWTEVLEMEVK